MGGNDPVRRYGNTLLTGLVVVLALALLFFVKIPLEELTGPPARAEWLNIAGTIPLPGEALENQLVVYFDAPISLSAAAEARPFSIDPALDGQYRVGPNFVALRPESAPPDTLFRVVLNSEIQSRGGKKLDPQRHTLVFASFVFQPKRLWTLEERPEHTVVGILFPTPVNLDSLKQHITVRTPDGQPVASRVEQGTAPESYRLVIEGNTTWPVTVVVSKGVTDQTDQLQMAADWTYFYPSERALAVNRVEWGRIEPENQQIVLEFSRDVTPENLQKHLTILDDATGTPVPFEVIRLREPGADAPHELAAELNLGSPVSADLTITIAAGLPGAEKSSLPADFSTKLHLRAEPLRVEDTWWNWLDKDGLALFVRLNNPVELPDLKGHIEFAPELTGLRLERGYDADSFRVLGDWDSRQHYEMRLTPGLKYSHAISLAAPVAFTFTSEEVPSYIGFGQEGKYYFPRRTGLTVNIESRNIKRAEVVVYQMFPSNIAVALRDLDEGRGDWSFIDSWCKEVGKTELALVHRPDRLTQTPLELDPLFTPDKKGVFCLRTSGKKDDGGLESATKILLRTDIGLLAHWQKDELVLFAHNLYSLAPIPLAKVTLYSTKNQSLAQGSTDDQGIVRLGGWDALLGEPTVAVVEKGEDSTFLELDPREDDSAPWGPDTPLYDRQGYDGFLYADRDLYRPGETVHLRWLVRTNYGDALENVPLLVTVVKPNGRDLLSQPTTLSGVGTGGLDLPTDKVYPTGKYTARLSVPGSTKWLGTYEFSLEEFVPNRIKASVTLPEKRWIAGKEHEIHLNAQHLFGAPAADRKCEAKVIFKRGELPIAKWPGYHFGNDSSFWPDPVSCGELKTDEQGNAVFKFSYIVPAEVTFPMKAVVLGRAFELGGRAVVGTAESMLFPSEVCLGIGAKAGPDGRGVEVFAAAMRPDETPAPLDKVKITLEKQLWHYYVRRYYGHFEPKWSDSFEPVETREVVLVDGKGSTTFLPEDYGYYRVRVHSDATPQFSTLSFYCYDGRCHLVDAARPSLLKLALDKEMYEPGEEASVRLESPFDGQGLVVLQGDTIHQMIPVTIQNNVGLVRFTVGREHFPNVWVEATVIHAVQEGKKQVYPFSSAAVAPLRVRDPQRALALAFPSLPEEIRPAAPAQFEIEVRDASGNPAEVELTLAAVDEGIHAITGYPSPDPLAWLGRLRKPDYRRAHYYDKVAYDFEKPAAGGDVELAARAAGIGESWIRPVALWSGVVQADKDGRAVVTMDVPEFTGQLRLVAVASSAAALGSHSANVFVRRPYMLQTSMPRFLLPGDAVRCRATLFNHTDSPCKAKVSWGTGGTLRETSGSRELEVSPHGEANLQAEFAAGEAIGQGEIRWEAVILDASGQEVERLKEVAPIPVREPAAYQSHHEMITVQPGENRDVSNTRFKDDARTQLDLTVGASPFLRLEKALRYLTDFPYGCVEQLTSRLMPLYLLRQNAPLLDSALKDQPALDQYILAGISRLFSLQTASGGLGFWPGADSQAPYGSIYALHFLTLVKNGREYELPGPNLEALEEYVRGLVADESDQSEPTLYQRAYALYVLALGGDRDALEQIPRFDTIMVPRAARFLLAAALAQHTQDRDRIKLYLSTAPSSPYTITEPDATLNSDIRNTAIELMALRQIGGNPQELLEKANQLFAFIESHVHGTTHETAFIVTALAGYLSDLATNVSAASATISGPDKQEEIRGPAVYRSSHKGAGGVFEVSNTGGTPLFVNVTTRGVPEKVEQEAVSEGISIGRRFYTGRGAPHDSLSFEQMASYVVELQINCERVAKNLIVADLLPAGLEIENPRLDPGALPGTSFTTDATPSYQDLRDDRLILAFDELGLGPHHFHYVVRAITPGKYQYPPVQAECMYDASIRAASAPSSIEVK